MFSYPQLYKEVDYLHLSLQLKSSVEIFYVKNQKVTQPLIREIDFEKHNTNLIIGTNGAGKSTIVNLLPRLYEVEKGDIRIDGVSIKQISKKSLRESLSFVPQKPFLFFDTIYSNN